MKKFLALIMCIGLSFSVVACSDEPAEDTSWIKDEAAKIDEELTSGQFVINGVVFQFPMDLQYWLDNGWHISRNYDNVNKFTLDPGGMSSEFELFHDEYEDQYVKVSVINNSDKDAKVQDCMVSSVLVTTTKVDVVLPQGVNKRDKSEEILKTYGEPTVKEGAAAIDAFYYYDSEDLWKCQIELSIDDDANDSLIQVEYKILTYDEIWDFYVETEGFEATCAKYFDAAMEASFYAKYDTYVSNGADTLEGAQALYQSELDYYVDFLIYYMELNEDYMTEEQYNRLVNVGKEVLSKVKWEVVKVEGDEDSDATIEVKLYPTDLLDIADGALDNALSEFYAKYEGIDFNTMTDAEYALVENDYTELTIKAYEEFASKAAPKDAITKTYDVDAGSAVISNEAWSEVDDIIIDAYVEE